MPDEASVDSAIDSLSGDEGQSNPETPEAPAATDGQGDIQTPEDAEQGYLRHSDYTRKTQELAQQREEFEAQQEQAQQLSELAKAAFNGGDEDALQEFLEAIEYGDGDEAEYGDETSPEVAELRQRLDQQQEFIDGLKDQQEKAQTGQHIESELLRLTGNGWDTENPDHDAILDLAIANSDGEGPPNVEAGFKKFNELKDRIISDYREGKFSAASNDHLNGTPAQAAIHENASPEDRVSAILESHGY